MNQFPRQGTGQFPPGGFLRQGTGQFPPGSFPRQGAGQFPPGSFPRQGAGQFPPRGFPRQETGQFPPGGSPVPPPPLPPWVNQHNFLRPPPLSSSVHVPPSVQVPPPSVQTPPPSSPLIPPPFGNSLPPFRSHAFQGLPLPRCCTNIPVRSEASGEHEQEVGKHKCSESQTEVDNWLRRRGVSYKIQKSRPKSNIQIHVVREKLNAVLSLIRDLDNGARTLSVMVRTVTESEWNQKCCEIQAKKKQLTELLEELNLSDEDMKTVKAKYLERSKKRKRLSRQKERRRKVKEEERVMTQNKHVQLDNWLREMQEDVERTQREEELKREADAVLWSITQKKTESRRQAALLSALLELRQVRVKRLLASGKPVSDTQIDVFNTVIEGLQKMWEKHLEDIGLEEQVLRGMLTQVEVKDDPVRRHKKLVLQEWEVAIFGTVGSLDSNLRGDELTEVRWSWDQFVASGQTLMSSTVPAGWVLPVSPSNAEWQKLLKY